MDLDEKVRVFDGPEEDMQVRGREKEERKQKRLSIRKRDKYRLLSPELKREKKKAGLDEDVVELNSTYQEMFEATLEYFEVSNIRDLPEEKKKEFFAIVDVALEEAKMAKKDHDGDGKIETSTAEYMGSRDKAIKKAMKPSWDSKQARANALNSLDKKAQAKQDMKKEEFILDEDDLVLAIEEEMTTGWRPDMGHAGTQGTINLGGKEHNARKVPIKHYDEFKKKHPGSKVMFRGPRQGKQNTKKSNAHHFYIIHKKGGVKESFEDNEKRREKARADMAAGKYNKDGSLKDAPAKVKLRGFGPDGAKGNMSNPAARASLMKKEEAAAQDEMIQQVTEYITSKQVKMAKGIANDPRHKGGDYSGAADKMEKIKKGLSNHPAAKKALQQANEEMTPAQKAERLKTIAKAADRVQSGARDKATKKQAVKDMTSKGASDGMAKTKGRNWDSSGYNYQRIDDHPGKADAKFAKGKHKYIGDMHKEENELNEADIGGAHKPKAVAKKHYELIHRAVQKVQGKGKSAAEKEARRDMMSSGAQKGMAPTKKKEVEEQVQELRKMIKEGNNKIEAYKLLSKILNNAENLGE